MKSHMVSSLVSVLIIGLTMTCFFGTTLGSAISPPEAELRRIQAAGYEISGPYTHENLNIFLIHGGDASKNKQLLTLQEALAQKQAIVYETGNVNELVIQNVAGDVDIYIQSGDIVKGGKQDRVIAYDLIISPKSGKIPINAFCVEHGRWTQRQGEAVSSFGSSQEQLASKELKRAVKERGEQAGVWQEVAKVQDKLEKNTGGSVKSAASPSSLQLTLENKTVRASLDNYLKALSTIVEGKPDVIGYAFAINGKINSADVYASNALFKKLWPKLLKSSTVEALAELQKGKQFKPATTDAVKVLFVDAEKGRAAQKDVTPRVRMVTRETENNLFYETRDRQQKDGWVHRSYITKE